MSSFTPAASAARRPCGWPSPGPRPGKRGADRLTQAAVDTDLVTLRLRIAQTGHIVTTPKAAHPPVVAQGMTILMGYPSPLRWILAVSFGLGRMTGQSTYPDDFRGMIGDRGGPCDEAKGAATCGARWARATIPPVMTRTRQPASGPELSALASNRQAAANRPDRASPDHPAGCEGEGLMEEKQPGLGPERYEWRRRQITTAEDTHP